eukprot:g21194.t1
MPKGELRTTPILAAALSAGKRVYCPRVMKATESEAWMEFFEVRSLEEASTLPLSKWKIPEPPDRGTHRGRTGRSAETFPRIEATDLDLLLVPAVALDLGRRRCGQGMGFYDRYIQRARRDRPPERLPLRTIGIGLLEQRQEEVPCEEHDELLDGVIFPDGSAFAPSLEEAVDAGPCHCRRCYPGGRYQGVGDSGRGIGRGRNRPLRAGELGAFRCRQCWSSYRIHLKEEGRPPL